MGLSAFSKILDAASSLSLSAACSSHTGKRRKNNEDNFFFGGQYMSYRNQGLGSVLQKSFSLRKNRFFAVFDGMGGGEYGEIASYMAAKAAAEYLEAEEDKNSKDKKKYLEEMTLQMSGRIYQEASRLEAGLMGSTLAALYFADGWLWSVNVGDSRCYLLRDGKLRLLSKDQTDEDYMKENGISGRKPYLTQYLGMDPEEMKVLPYISCLQQGRADRFLICSDGLTDMLPLSVIEGILLENQRAGKIVERLLEEALVAGGKDNITAIVIDL